MYTRFTLTETSKFRPLAKLFLALVLVLGMGSFSKLEATHYRYGSMSWQPTSGNTVQMKITQGWRRSFFGNPVVGATVNTGTLYFGDGSWSAINLTVTSVNTVDDWFFGEFTVNHTYATSGNYTAYYQSCCRISTLKNNRDGNFRSETIVTVGTGNSSPVTTIAPIINLQTNLSAASFFLPANDPDGDPLTYRLATASEAAGGSFSNPSGISINASTGEVTFNTIGTTVGDLYNVALVVEDGNTKTMADFIIKIVNQSTPPYFDYSVTPASGYTYQVAPGTPVSFDVLARDNDFGSTVVLSAVGLPIGSTMNPGLPAGPSNPVSSTFSWTPSSSQLGSFVINFTAQDNNGVQTSTSISIQVSLKPVFDVPPTPAAGVHLVFAPGDMIQYTVQASDPDSLDIVTINLVEGKAMNGTHIALYSGASFSPIPTTAANPTSGVFTWQTQASDWGHRHVFFTAEDGYGDKAVHEVSMLLNTNPAFLSSPISSVNIGQTYSYLVVTSDPDTAYGDSLELFGFNLPSWLTFIDYGNGTGLLTGTPSISDVGAYNVNLEVQDIHHHSNVGGIPSQNFTITVNPCAIVLGYTVVDESCLASNGSIHVTANGVNLPAQYSWTGSNGFSASSLSISGVPQGNYQLSITDTFGCTASLTAAVGGIVDTVKPVFAVYDYVEIGLDTAVNYSFSSGELIMSSYDGCPVATTYFPSSVNCDDAGVIDTIMVVQTDVYGNSDSAFVAVKPLDITAPIVNIYHKVVVQLDDDGNAMVFPSTFDSLTWDRCTDVVFTLSQTKFDCTDLPMANVTLTVEDENGNSESDIWTRVIAGNQIYYQKTELNDYYTVTVFIDDCIPPVAICKDIEVQLDQFGKASILPDDVNDGSFDNCNLWYFTLDDSTFTCSDVGNQWVNLHAYDMTGNMACCPVQVTVRDTINPVAVCKDIIVYLDSVGSVVVKGKDLDGGTTGNCDVETFELSDTAFTCGSLGVNLVQMTAIDNNGNQSSCHANVTVLDSLKPVAICRNISVGLDSNGIAQIQAADIDGGSFDNCQIVSITIDKSSFTCGDLGNNLVRLTVTDQSGNWSACEAWVNVYDSIAPSLVCQNITAPLAANGYSTITVNDVIASYSDNCSSNYFTASISDSIFDCTSGGVYNVTVKVWDSAGNVDSCVATVTVVDKPIAECKNATIYLSESGSATLQANQVDGGSFDACGIDTMWISKSMFTCENLGTNSVMLTVCDADGNCDSCFASVTVLDTNGMGTSAQIQDVSCFGGANGSIDLSVTGGNTLGCQGFSTFTQGGWSTSCSGNNPGCYRDAHFANAFPVGLTIGCSTGFSATFTSSAAIRSFLPAGGSPSVLNANLTDPSSTSAGVLAGQLVAATLNMTFDSYDSSFASSMGLLANNTINLPSSPFHGMKVSDVIDLANQFIGGCLSGFSASDINVVLTKINENYNHGNNQHLRAPYAYSWSNGAHTEDLINVPAGSYTVTISDCGNCTYVETFVISQPSLLEVSVSGIDPTCATGTDGSASASVTGGTAPYTYLWSNLDTSASIVGLADGTFSVMVTDANGCQATGSVSIARPVCCNVTSGGSITGNQEHCGPFDPSPIASNALPSGGLGGVEYIWMQSNVNVPNTVGNPYWSPIPGSNGHTYDPGYISQTTYYIRCSRSIGCTFWAGESNVVAVIVNPIPDVAIASISDVSCVSNTCPDLAYQRYADASTGLAEFNGLYFSAEGRSGNNAMSGTFELDIHKITPYTPTVSSNFVWPNGTQVPFSIDYDPSLSGNDRFVFTLGSGASQTVLKYDPLTVFPNNVNGVYLYSRTAPNTKLMITDLSVNGNSVGQDFGYAYPTTSSFENVVFKGTEFQNAFTITGNVEFAWSGTIPQNSNMNFNFKLGNIDCTGGSTCDGAVDIDVTSGTSPFSYAWSNGQTSQDIDDLCAGDYTVVVTDAKGCVATETFTVNEPLPLTASYTVLPATCADNNDGSATIIPSGGNQPYGYAWSSGATSATADSLLPGVYSVIITDSKGCQITVNVTVGYEDTQDPIAVCKNISIYLDANGQAAIVAADVDNGSYDNCGIGNISIDKEDFTCADLGANAITLTVTDVNGNSSTCTATVTVVDDMDPVVLCKNISVLLDSNGMASITYADIDFGTTDNCSIASRVLSKYNFTCADLGQVTITYEVIDQSGNSAICQSTVTVLDYISPRLVHMPGNILVVADSSDCSPSANWTPPTGTDNCSVVVTSSHNPGDDFSLGTTTVTYTATDGSGNSTNGTFTVTVTKTPLSITTTSLNVDCYGAATGSASVLVKGGCLPYSYQWSSGSTSYTATGLTAGNHTVTVTDGSGESQTITVTITQPSQLSASVSVTNVSCGGSVVDTCVVTRYNSSSHAIWLPNLPNGVSNKFWFAGNGGSLVQYPDGTAHLSGEIYNANDANKRFAVSVWFANKRDWAQWSALGRSYKDEANVAGSNYLNWWYYEMDVNKSNTLTGLADYSGDVLYLAHMPSNYMYGFQVGTAANSKDSDYGMSGWFTYTGAWSGHGDFNFDGSCGNAAQCDGEASVTASGGTAPYTYQWSTGGISTVEGNLCAGTHSVVVTDANGCALIKDFTVTAPAELVVSVSGNDPTCATGTNGSASASVTGGTAPYSYLWSTGGTSASVSGLSDGTYSVIVTDANGCQATGSVSIARPVCCNVTSGGTISGNQENCGPFDPSPIASNALPSGGLGGVEYIWMQSHVNVPNTVGNPYWSPIPGSNGPTYDPGYITQTTYYIRCSRSVGCTFWAGESNVVALTVNPIPAASGIVVQNVSCFSGNDGSASVNVSGGTSPYAYAWSNSQTAQTISGLIAGTYNVVVTDAKGCTVSAQVQIDEPSELTASLLAVDTVCFGGSDGSIDLTIAGGTATYAINWTKNGSYYASSEDLTGLSGGTYMAAITDANGCSISLSHTIIERAAFALSATVSNAVCFGSNTGSIDLEVTGGSSSSASTDFWKETFEDNNLCATSDNGSTAWSRWYGSGNNYAHVTSRNGGKAFEMSNGDAKWYSESIDISSYNTVDVSVELGSVQGNQLEASGPYIDWVKVYYKLDNGNWTYFQTNYYTAGQLSSSNIHATLSGISGSTLEVKVWAHSTSSNEYYFVDNVTVTGYSSASTYTYQWSNAATGQDIDQLVAGTYVVTVTNDHGCVVTDSFEVGQPTELVMVADVVDVSCGSNASCDEGIATLKIKFTGDDGATVVIKDENGNPIDTFTNLSANDILSVSASGMTNGIFGNAIQLCQTECVGMAYGNNTASGCRPAVSALFSCDNQSVTTYSTKDLSNVVLKFADGTEYKFDNLNCGKSKNFSGIGTNDGKEIVGVWIKSGCNSSGAGPGYGEWVANPNGVNCVSLNTLCTENLIGSASGDFEIVGYIDTYGREADGNGPTVYCDGAIDLTISGGTAPYVVNWGDGETGNVRGDLCQGDYLVMVTDANGCVKSMTVTVGQTQCCNVTDAGTIAQSQNGCGPFDPAILSNAVGASGGDGTLEYKWLYSTSSSSYSHNDSSWIELVGATAESYDPATIGQTTYLVRLAKRGNCTAWLASNIVALTVNPVPSVQIVMVQAPTCAGQLASLQGSISGSYSSYEWFFNGQPLNHTSLDLVGAPQGIYVLVAYGNLGGCTNGDTLTVVTPSGPQLTAQITNSQAQATSASCDCNGRMRNFTVIYSGTSGVTIKAYNAKKNTVVATFTNVQDGDTLTVNGFDKSNRLESKTFLRIGSSATYTEIHTSCSIDILNKTYGSYYVISYTDGDGNYCNGGAGYAACDVNFNGLAHGQLITNQLASNGISLSVNSYGSYVDKLIVFDTDEDNTADPDLEVNIGNVLIFPENTVDQNNDGIYDSPDDQPVGGEITMVFDELRIVKSFKFVDSENNQGRAYCYDVNNNLLSTTTIAATGDGTVQTVNVNTSGVKKLKITFTTSGGVGDFKFDCPSSGNCDGEIDLSIAGGQAPYSVSWSTGASVEDLDGVCPGNYTVTVTDANGCTSIETFTVGTRTTSAHSQKADKEYDVDASEEQEFGKVEGAGMVSSYGLYPNPATQVAVVSYELVSSMEVKVYMTDLSGRLVTTIYAGAVAGAQANAHSIDLSQVMAGTYLVIIEGTNGDRNIQRLVVAK